MNLPIESTKMIMIIKIKYKITWISFVQQNNEKDIPENKRDKVEIA